MNAMCAVCRPQKSKLSANKSLFIKNGARSCSSAISTASPRATCTVGRALVVLLLQELTEANVQAHRLQLRGLDPDKTYRLYNIPGRVDVRTFGSLINTVTPVHVRQDSVLHNVIAKQVKMSGEVEKVTATGSVLMHTGVMLSPAFSGSGFNEKVRIFPDFAARLYFLEAEENKA